MIFILDNYDSFTYNLVDYVKQLGADCIVYRNDEISLNEISKISFDKIIISPGPGVPSNSGITIDLIRKYASLKPILGVCLGHQAIGELFGAKLVKAIKPMHGKTSKIYLEPHFIFNNLPEKIEVMRYHSLILENVKTPLKVIAKTKKNEVMAIAHEKYPLIGIQFHPESILTNDGLAILRNWINFKVLKSNL